MIAEAGGMRFGEGGERHCGITLPAFQPFLSKTEKNRLSEDETEREVSKRMRTVL